MEQGKVWIVEWKSSHFQHDLWYPILQCFESRHAARECCKRYKQEYPDATKDQFRICRYVRKV